MTLDLKLMASMGPELLRAAGMTLSTWLAGTVAAVVLGFLVAVLRRYGPGFLNPLLRVYVEVMRGTPFLIQRGGSGASISIPRPPNEMSRSR